MGTVQKVLWWIWYYAVTWFALVIVWGVLDEFLPKPIMGFLILVVFAVPAWYANRKVKQKALKKEMEQRTGNYAPQVQPVSQPPQPAPILSQPSTPLMAAQPDIFDEGKNQQVRIIEQSVEKELPDLNTATVEALTQLSAVNRILAMKIVDTRDKEGDYASFEDLFARVQLSAQAQEEIRRHFSLTVASDGRFIDI